MLPLRINDPHLQPGAVSFGGWEVDAAGTKLTVWIDERHPHGPLRLFTSDQADAIHVLLLDTGADRSAGRVAEGWSPCADRL